MDAYCNKHQRKKEVCIFENSLHFYCPDCGREEEERRKKEEAEVLSTGIQKSINERIENSMLAPRFKEKTFENFKIENEGQRKATEAAHWFLENWPRSTGLILLGNPGTGKNHLAAAIVHEWVKSPRTALFTEVVKIIRVIKDSWRNKGEAESQILKSFLLPDLLIIDEVGVQFGSSTEKLYITEIINDRYNALKPTILIGNLKIDELKQVIGERAVERFKEGGRVVTFTWDSWRGRDI